MKFCISLFCGLTAAILTPMASMADPVDPSEAYGTWVPAGEKCAIDGVASSAAFTLDRWGVTHFESRCENTETPLVSDDGTQQTYVVSCDNGVETMIQKTIYTLGLDDLLTVNNQDGSTFVYKRCS